MNKKKIKQQEVQDFWNEKPCDSDVSQKSTESIEYFLEIERDRYKYQGHINEILDYLDWSQKQVLEIGTGVGTDARNIISRGGAYTGINVDRGSVDITARALDAFKQKGNVFQCSATDIILDDESMDVVYSFGVLHHIPEVKKALKEIYRVLKPGGEILIMLYNRNSINYKLEIRFIRRLVLRMLSIPGVITVFTWLGLPRAKLERHRELYKQYGHLGDQEWLNRNTDGPDNPYSLVYSASEAEKLLKDFNLITNEVYFFDYRHWGVFGRLLPVSILRFLGKKWGWHRVLYAKKVPVAEN